MSIVEFRLHQNSNIKIKVATQLGERPFFLLFFSKVKKTAFALLQYYLKLLSSSLTNLLSVCLLPLIIV